MSTRDTQRERRRYADQIEQQRRAQRQARIAAGTEPSRMTKGRNIMEGIVSGLLLAEFWRAFKQER